MKTFSKNFCCNCVNLAVVTAAIWLSTTLFLSQAKKEELRQATLLQETRIRALHALLAPRPSTRSASVPLYNLSHASSGALQEALERLQDACGGYAAVFSGDVCVASISATAPAAVTVGERLPPAIAKTLGNGLFDRGERSLAGTTYLVAYDPIHDQSGRRIGALFVGEPRDSVLAGFRTLQLRSIVTALAVNLVLAFLVCFVGCQRRRSERALNEREHQQKAILNNIPDLAWLKDKESRFVAVNEAYGRACGFAPEELIGKTDLEVWPAPLAQRYRHEDQEVMQLGVRKQCDEPLVKRDGSSVWTEVVRTPVLDGRGQVIGLTGIARDITDRRRMERSLQDSETTLRQIFNSAHYGIILQRFDGTVARVNDTALGMFGMTVDEALEFSLAQDLSAEEGAGEKLQAAYQKAKEGKTLRFEWKARRPGDGSGFDVELCVCAIRLSEESLLLVTLTDISWRKLQEARMKHALSLLSATLDSTGDGILVLDTANRILRYNNRYLEIMKFEAPGDFSRQPGSDYLLEQVRDPAALLRDLAAEESNPHRESHSVLTLKDGRVVERVSHPQVVDGAIVGRVLCYRDVTEQKKLESQLRHAQKMEAMGTLTGGIAHDFNNILTVIIGCSTLMQGHLEKGGALNSYLEQISAAAEKAAALTRGLLAYSRRQTLEPKPVDLNSIVGAVDSLLSRLIGEDVALKTRLSPLPLTVLADSGQMEQVLMNLATNARDAMNGAGELTIETSCVAFELDTIAQQGFGELGRYALITVSDSGKGIDSASLERIFEPFYTTKGPEAGTGLGLSIVYGIIKQHNGYITVRSEVGVGTTFELYLPLTDVAQEGVLAAKPQKERRGSETILLIEDDQEIRSLFSDVLSRSGYRIIQAVDGEDGVHKFRQNQESVSLMLIDMMMPKKSGTQTFKEICSIKEGMKAIFISGYTDDIINRREIEAGQSHFLPKPLAPADLLEKVRQVLDEAA